MPAQHSLAVFPWIEANQGFLSLAALVLALVAFVVQNRRANEAELQSRAEARRAQLAAIEHAQEAERKETERIRRLELGRLKRSIDATYGVISSALLAVNTAIAQTSQSPAYRMPNHLVDRLTDAADSLEALVPTGPLDSDLVLLTQRAARLARSAVLRETDDSISANQLLNTVKDGLGEANADLLKLHREMWLEIGGDLELDPLP